MPRAGKRSTARSGAGSSKTQAVKVLKTPPALLVPGDKDYDPNKDGMVVGFQLGSGAHYASRMGKDAEKLNPYDFLTDEKTGMRPSETAAPHGAATIVLAVSQSTLIDKWTTLPPLRIWRQGFWLSEKIFDPTFDYEEMPYSIVREIDDTIKVGWPESGTPAALYNYWVTTGEGTPGNYLWRVWEIPGALCNTLDAPKHPLMWDQKFKRGSWGGLGSGPAYGGHAQTKPAEPEQPALPKPVKVTIPAGVRVRCAGCGHWWKIDDLAKHADVCAGVETAGETDWAMMCDPLCGCGNLTDVAKCKPGFPRKKEDPPAAEETEAASEPLPITT